jgi:tRNA(Met) cytidine acetyltransferase
MTDDVAAHAAALRAEARATNQRRLLVLAGGRGRGLDALFSAVAVTGVDEGDVTLVSTREGVRFERVPPPRAGDLLGTTRTLVALDCHEGFSPNALGRVVGAVDGGGLLVLLVPPLDGWPETRGRFEESLAVPPFGLDDVTGRFKRRLRDTLDHPGVSVVDVDGDRVVRDGRTGATSSPPRRPVTPPADRSFPAVAYETCLTRDQARAVRALERLRGPDDGESDVVVVEADRGRGKSAAAGLAAGSLAADGLDVLVTAPTFRGAEEVLTRAASLLESLGSLDEDGSDARTARSVAGGRVRYVAPTAAASLPDDPDAVVVDEAAALPVRLLERLLAGPPVAFVTTVHGYEGAGRGFSVRFRDRLAESDRPVHEERLEEPVRHARDDPVEAWSFRALLLDARPAVGPAVADATPESVDFRRVTPGELLADEHLLRESFGLLVLAHYRTEPNDLARLLDAPNLSTRVLTHEGHVVAVAMLAREGGLDEAVRREMYEGGRVRGNMIPDVLTSQLRDEDAGAPVGTRVVRIAVHHAVRSRGLGSHLLERIHDQLGDDRDWFGVGYGATPDLLDFWRSNGYRTVHLSTTRNDASGEFSAVMLTPASVPGERLARRHGRRFRDRVAGVLGDACREADADVVRAALRAVDAPTDPDLSAYEWRVVADAAYGPGLSDVAPDPFARLTVAALVDDLPGLDARDERLLVRRTLQRHRWPSVADELGFHSTGECMRAFGRACRPLVDAYGDGTAREERDRFGGE